MRRLFFVFALFALQSCGSDQVVVREIEAKCGNAEIELNEDCDDGNTDNGDACTNACEHALCGDSVIRNDVDVSEEGFEACDDGNRVPTDACTNSCESARCGDGVRRGDLQPGEEGYEVCDDGNDVQSDACLRKGVRAIKYPTLTLALSYSVTSRIVRQNAPEHCSGWASAPLTLC